MKECLKLIALSMSLSYHFRGFKIEGLWLKVEVRLSYG